jgi:hypothetical protein
MLAAALVAAPLPFTMGVLAAWHGSRAPGRAAVRDGMTGTLAAVSGAVGMALLLVLAAG